MLHYLNNFNIYIYIILFQINLIKMDDLQNQDLFLNLGLL